MVLCKLHILYEFQCTKIFLIFVANRHVVYIEWTALFFKPYGHIIAVPFTEGIDDAAHNWFYLWWMAGEHIATDCRSWTFKDLFAVIKIAVNVFMVNKGYLHRHCVEHCVQLVKGESTTNEGNCIICRTR